MPASSPRRAGPMAFATSAFWSPPSDSLVRPSLAKTSTRTLWGKASALGFSLISNHPFVDGNKRIGHAALEAMLMLNGLELSVSVDDAESEILAVAAGDRTREQFHAWVDDHVVPVGAG